MVSTFSRQAHFDLRDATNLFDVFPRMYRTDDYKSPRAGSQVFRGLSLGRVVGPSPMRLKLASPLLFQSWPGIIS